MSKVHRSFKKHILTIVLAFSCLLAIVSIASLFETEPAQTALSKSGLELEISRQVAEAEEAPMTSVLIGTWTEALASSSATSSQPSSETTKDSALPAITSTKTVTPKIANTPVAPKPTVAKTLPVKTAPTVSSAFSLSVVGNQIHTKTNSARSSKNLPSLAYDPTLASIAKNRSTDMATRGYFSHTSPNGCDLACRVSGLSYISYGENLGEYTEYTVFTEAKLAARFIEMWLNSPSHRKNLLSSGYTHQGVGVATKGDRIVVTVLFGSK